MATTNAISISARVHHFASNRTDIVTGVFLDQTGQGKAGNEIVVTTTPTSFVFTGITIPGQSWFLNLGSNDIQIGILVSAAFKPVWLCKPGLPVPIFLDPAVFSTTILQASTASGTSLLDWYSRQA